MPPPVLVPALLSLLATVAAQHAPGVPPPRPGDEIRFHEPGGSPAPSPSSAGQPAASQPVPGRGPAPRQRQYVPKHTDINVNLDREREHIKKQVQEDYLDLNTMDDSKLLMQYFRKHDTDKNHKLDGLELLKAIANMEEDHSHSDEDEGGHGDHDPGAGEEDPGAGPLKVDIEQIIPIVDSILQQDDKNKDGYLNYAEFMSRQKQHMRAK